MLKIWPARLESPLALVGVVLGQRFRSIGKLQAVRIKAGLQIEYEGPITGDRLDSLDADVRLAKPVGKQGISPAVAVLRDQFLHPVWIIGIEGPATGDEDGQLFWTRQNPRIFECMRFLALRGSFPISRRLDTPLWTRRRASLGIGGIRGPDQPSPGSLTGPAISRSLGTQAVFQLSKVVPQTAHSKLLICRRGAIARRFSSLYTNLI